MTFQELGLCTAILNALRAQGYVQPTPIQKGAIPPALKGRDVLGIAQTGTGKTCAFATPILQRLSQTSAQGKRPIRSLILTPTRELALQIQESFVAYGKQLPLRSAVIFGGVGQTPQVEQLRRGVDILVATPGRLLDLHGQGLLDLSQVEIFVLDEADRMLDMGFIHDVRKVLKLLPEKKQTLFFSATMPPEVQSLVNALLHDPAKVAVTPVSSPVEVIEQSLYYVDKPNKSKLLAYLVNQPGVKNALVFSRTKHGANKIATELTRAGITAAAIHGNKSQTARQQALSDFKAGRIKVLAATDIAARGLDIEELSHVFNYNLPDVPETYVHRIGRTGRAGHGGVAISFCDISEKDDLKGIEKLLGRSIPVVEDHPWPMENFTPPQRDKHGKLINPEDAEARQAARERKQQRRQTQAQPQPKPQPQASPSRREAEPRRAANASVTAKHPQPQAQPQPTVRFTEHKPDVRSRTPAQKRQAAGYKPSKTLDDALTAMSPKTETPAAKSERDLAFERWMAEERAIQAQKGYTGALDGDVIMDATARLLAPRKPAQPSQLTQPRREERRTLRPEPSEKPRAERKPQPKVQPKPQLKTQPKPQPKAQPKPQAQPKLQPKSQSKPQPQRPKQPAASLEERKARIRAEAKARRERGEPPKSAHQKDSTEQPSLMKPYYLSDD